MPLGRLDHDGIPAEAWLAFGHEPAPEPAHAARSGDPAPTGPAPASAAAEAPKAPAKNEDKILFVASFKDPMKEIDKLHDLYDTLRDAREQLGEQNIPFLGTCGGLQYAVLEYFRNVLGLASASHAESDGVDDTNVVRALACSLDGEERVVRPIAGTRFSALVNDEPFVGMHYCNYGPGP